MKDSSILVLLTAALALASTRPMWAVAPAPQAQVPAAAAQDAPFINSWLLCGPFEKAVDPEKVTPKIGVSQNGMKWEYFDDRLWNRNYDNYQDLSGYYGIRKGVDTRNKFVYASTCAFSPADQTAEFRFGTSGSYRLFVNGAQVAQSDKPKEVQRDMFKQAVTLKKGWNLILVEIRHDCTEDRNANGAPIAKDAAVSYLGLYGRLSDKDGAPLPGVVYSTVGDGATLSIDARPLAATDVVPDAALKGRGLPSNILPIGYAEWPYVWNKSLYGRDSRRIWADPYRFEASGGQPGYRFAVVAGALPDGLTLKEDGAIDGFCAKMGEFTFTVQVTDAQGAKAQKKLSITVKDRPTRRFEEGRVGALSHCPAVYPFWVDANYSVDLWAQRAKREGHALVSVESLQQNYYWPSKFEDPKHPRNQYQPRDKDGKVRDGLKPFADAVKRYGMQFGFYYATEGGGLGHYSVDVFVQNCSDLIRRYDPAYLYFDGPQAMPGANYDVMYSNVRNYGDDIILNANVWGGDGEFGDVDLGTSEASPIYSGADPVRTTKRIIVEPWKTIITKNNYNPYYGKRDDFRQVAKEMVMNAARGFVDNNDQMPLMSRGPNWDSPADIARRYPMAVQEDIDVREGLARWFAPTDLPERHESTTGTVPYFLSGCGYADDGKGNINNFARGKGPGWGYATARDNDIYLHFIQGPDGKKGYAGEKTVTIAPVPHRVQKITWLNQDQPLAFTQQGDSLTITLDGISADPVDTIVKIVTDDPARKYKLTHLVTTGRQLAPDTLRVMPEGHMTYPALKVPFTKGEVRFTSSDTSVAKVDADGTVTAVAPGNAVITAEATHESASATDALPVIVDAGRNIRVGGELIGAVLRVKGKEAFTTCAGTGELPFILEGRSKKGGPVSLATAKVAMKCGVVEYTKGTPFQPVFIEEKPVFTFKDGQLAPVQTKETTRAAVWAEVDLDGAKFTTNKVFLDMDPAVPATGPETLVTASGQLGDAVPAKVLDGADTPDGYGSGMWSVDGKTPSWIAFDFKSPRKISLVNIHFNTLDQHYINTPDLMEIQTSQDGTKWTTLTTVAPPAQGHGAYFGFADTFHFKPTTASHLRLAFPKGNSRGTSVDLLEVAVQGSLLDNLAIAAKVTTSSISNANYPGENAIDGIVGEHGRGEWASKNEANPWIRLDWEGGVTLGKIVLYDRPNPSDHLKQGMLTFSDGSSVEVADIANDGSPKVVTFPAKKVEWVKFQATGNKNGNNGLSEFEAYEAK